MFRLPRLLLDTHILIRWLYEPEKLYRTQTRALNAAVQRAEPVCLSAISLMEIALLAGDQRSHLKASLQDIFRALSSNPVFQVLPLSYDVALEFALMAALRDPSDRLIVATARVHRLTLITSDQRIIDSGLVPVLD